MKNINYSYDRLKVDLGERNHIRKVILRLKEEYSIRGLNILELGSGTGANLQILLPENNVLGVEGLVDAANHATSLGVKTIVANLEAPLSLDSAQFDWVLCLDVLEHLMAPDQALSEAHRLLRPGGKLLINVPNHFTLTGRIRMLLGAGIHWNQFFPDKNDWDNPHIRFFTRQSIGQLLSACGFQILRDLSPEVPAVPMSSQLTQLRLDRLIGWLALHNPNIFCGGFFLLAERATHREGNQALQGPQ